MKSIYVLLLLLAVSINSHAGWLDVSGKVVKIVTYAHTNTILVYLTSEGLAVENCSNTNSFAISKDMQPEARARMYSMLLAAKASDTTVVITFSNEGCEPWDSNQSAYRKIVRLQ